MQPVLHASSLLRIDSGRNTRLGAESDSVVSVDSNGCKFTLIFGSENVLFESSSGLSIE